MEGMKQYVCTVALQIIEMLKKSVLTFLSVLTVQKKLRCVLFCALSCVLFCALSCFKLMYVFMIKFTSPRLIAKQHPTLQNILIVVLQVTLTDNQLIDT